MPFAQVNGVELYYEVHGSGPTVVFAHGSGGNHLSWWQQVPFFSQHYTCITFDHRSFGRTRDGDQQGRRAFADDLGGLLGHLGVERVAIVAHSMGGRTAVGFTLRNPARVWGIVLCGSNGGSVNDESRQIREENQEHPAPRPNGTVRGLSVGFAARDPGRAFLYRQIMRLNPRHAPDFLAVAPGYRGSTHERLAASGAPILYVVGEEDVIAPPRTIEIAASQVPGSRLLRVPDSGHSVYYEQPDVFNQAVLAFLKDVAPSQAGGAAHRSEQA
ncbi:MAG: alpha/beta hydrolase [Chloroflexi bacterium]|nr:alpha/beta hydrolase [Chloroflexota bacterium]